MKIRSYDQLDFDLAWSRVLGWAQSGRPDVQDRLPYESLARVLGAKCARPAEMHHLSELDLVMSSKKSGTSRPFTRLNPLDLTLYQALVDRLAEEIEDALPPRDVVFAYRQDLTGSPKAFGGTPSRKDFETQIEAIFPDALRLAWRPQRRWPYALKTDLTGYFLNIDIDELERQLYSISSQPDVVRDLVELLANWQLLGVRGLPQGIEASSPLANLYFRPIDQLLLSRELPYVRWVDDLIIAVPGFHKGRELQDTLEKALYELGLTLASDKTRIYRARKIVEDSISARERLSRMKRARRQAFAAMLEDTVGSDYPLDEDELPDLGELDLEVAIEEYETLLRVLDEENLPPGFQSTCIAVLRDLRALGVAHELGRIPRLLERAPDLTGPALDYVATVGKTARAEAILVFAEMIGKERFLREHEKIAVCKAVLSLGNEHVPDLASRFGEWAIEDTHPGMDPVVRTVPGLRSQPALVVGVMFSYWAGER